MSVSSVCCLSATRSETPAPVAAGQSVTGTISCRTDGDGRTAKPRLISLSGGSFLMGCHDPRAASPGDRNAVRAHVEPFGIGATTVTNAEFANFVHGKNYCTEAERTGWSFVFVGLLPPPQMETDVYVGLSWWRAVDGASWRHPEGPGSDVAARMDHPAVHISLADALAYCAWSGARLPSEAEWEFAARGGLDAALYPWGNELTPEGRHMCNIWQGNFPSHNSQEDGYCGTAPASAFPPNTFGLHQMVGNVWEWCMDGSHSAPALRGGSYLCHSSYCARYKVFSRIDAQSDMCAGNLGFRVVI